MGGAYWIATDSFWMDALRYTAMAIAIIVGAGSIVWMMRH